MQGKHLKGAPANAITFVGDRQKLILFHEQLNGMWGKAPIPPWILTDSDFPHCDVQHSRSQTMTNFNRIHPKIGGVEYFEGVWIRRYFSMPDAVVILMPRAEDFVNKAEVLTIGNPNIDWVYEMIDRYIEAVCRQLGITFSYRMEIPTKV